MQSHIMRAGALLFSLAALTMSRSGAAFTEDAINTSNRIDGSTACKGNPSTVVESDTDIINGKCTGLKLTDIPVGDFTHIDAPEAPMNINRFYNNAQGHNGLDVEGGTECEGVNDVHAILQGMVILSMSEKQTGGANGWGESIVLATRASNHSDEIITHAYHHMHNQSSTNHPENTTRRKEPCDSSSAGEILGKEGSTGYSSGAHLHLTIRRWKNINELDQAIKDTAQGNTGPLLGVAYPGHNNAALARNLDPLGLLVDTFTDVENGGANGWAVEYVAHMRHLGVEFGLFDGSFGASKNVKRREAARWIKIASKRMLDYSPTQTFNDVPSNDPDFTYIETLARSPFPEIPPVINPTPASGSFYPDNEIARAEALKMVIMAFYREEYLEWYHSSYWFPGVVQPPVFSDVYLDDWYWPFVYFGLNQGIVAEKPSFYPNAVVTRAEAAKWVIEGYDHINMLPDFPCGSVCSPGKFCRPSTHTCEDVPECVQDEVEDCPVGGGAPDTCSDGVQNQGEMGVDCGGSCAPCGSCGDAVCNGSENQANCCQDCGGCPDCSDGQTISCGLCGTSTCSGGQYGSCQNQGVCSPGQVQSQFCNGNGTQSRTCESGCQWGAWDLCNGGCECAAGACCSNGCDYDAQGSSCGTCKECNGFGSCSQNEPDGTQCGGANICMNGVCGAPPCGAATYWTPTPDSDTDGTGTQLNGTINTAITVEVRESGAGLEARVCKPGGTFNSNIAFSIYDGATNSAVGVAVANLATSGQPCSQWVGLQNDNGYSNGQQFGGIWQVVSPAGSANDWNFPYNTCAVNGSPGGTCWNGINITMTRTCK